MPRTPAPGGLITAVEPGSLAAYLGIRPGDVLLAVNGRPCRDVIDVRFFASEEHVELTLLRDGRELTIGSSRDYDQPLGLEFANPTFDVDIRRCNNNCPFCFVAQMPPGMRRTLYVKDDDYRYSFLFGHFVTLTNLTEDDWDRIREQRLSPLYISVHATDPELRRRCLGNPRAPDVMEQMRQLAQYGIEMHTQVVVVPGLNDGQNLERTARDLATLWPHVRSVSIVPVGLTRFHRRGYRVNTRDEMEAVLERCERLRAEFTNELGVRFVYPTDEWYLRTDHPVPPADEYDGLALQENGLGLVRDFLDDWEYVREELDGGGKDELDPPARITMASGTLFAPVLRDVAGEFGELIGAEVDVVAVRNDWLGHTVTVAGLLTARDVIAQLSDRELGDVIALPRVMFDHPDGLSLDDLTPDEVARSLGHPVILADLMWDLADEWGDFPFAI